MQQIAPISIAQTLFQQELFSFTSRMIGDYFGLDRFQTAHLLKRMRGEGLIAEVERGKYLLLGLTPEKVLSNPLYIGTNLISPAYASFWSALHFHGLTEQVPQTVFLATTRRKSELAFHGSHYKFIQLKPDAFFGYRREIVGELPVVIADEAKALIDSLSLLEYAGGITEVAKGLKIAIETARIEPALLIEYALRLNNSSLRSRLGYLLEALQQPAAGLHPASGPVLLDPNRSQRGEYLARWKLYVNRSPDELFPQGVA